MAIGERQPVNNSREAEAKVKVEGTLVKSLSGFDISCPRP
jgi:hypothetical protein